MLKPSTTTSNLPRVGMLATIRNRRAIIQSVEPYNGKTTDRLHLVRLEYTDPDGVPEDTVIWEREVHTSLLEPTALSNVTQSAAMTASDFDALLRATRWTALSPFIHPDEHAKSFITSPFFGAVQTEDFQLVPILKMLRQPRVSLMLADDVGLGKTIEAGLILTELILKRRIRRVLILSPAALRMQWQQEMKSKFALSFDLIDRTETHNLQKRLGLDANPWRTYQRIITSYHYLKQPDVLEQFRTTLQQPEGSAQLPWDLLIVDEAHNLMPSNFGKDSDLSKMLRFLAPWFEHKLFLTATPHNGHTRCFSGLLEILDPVRFKQASGFSDKEREHIGEVVIRRLKSEINALDAARNRTPRFANRLPPDPIPLYYAQGEKLLAIAFQKFRSAVKSQIAQSSKSDQMTGSFAVEVLNKRLLSCPVAFADSWSRFKAGLAQEEQTENADVQAAKRAIAEDIDDDLETESRVSHAARTVGSWFKPYADKLTTELANVDKALSILKLTPDKDGHLGLPVEDVRWDRLNNVVIKERLRQGDAWNTDERLIIFTEYKTTLDYLYNRLTKTYPEPGAICMLFGGMDEAEREEIKRAFNDPDDPMRILVATDAASEGLNLQETARMVLHFDIPWNPAKLEQRNGRLDRHGQARDVVIYHFTSDDDADLKFLDHVVRKVNTIREDLGSMGEVFDAAFQRRFTDLEDFERIMQELDRQIETTSQAIEIPKSVEADVSDEQLQALDWLKNEIDISPSTLRDTLETALSIGIGLPRFDGPDPRGRLKLKTPVPPRWKYLIDDHLRNDLPGGSPGVLPGIVFDPAFYIHTKNGRQIFRSTNDTVLLHLGHPLFRHALAMFARARFPGGSDWDNASRWTVRYGPVPKDARAVIILSVEELAVNELREPFHHWVTSYHFPVSGDELGPELPHQPAADDQPLDRAVDHRDLQKARDIWSDIGQDVKDVLKQKFIELNERLRERLKSELDARKIEEKNIYDDRIKEVKKAMDELSLQKLEDERDKLLAKMRQGELFDTDARRLSDELKNMEEELKRRQEHYSDLLSHLQQEKERVLTHIIPKRYALRGQAQIFPVTIEIRLPEDAR